jgi:hypothetical protein
MDAAAVALCRDNRLPIKAVDLHRGNIRRGGGADIGSPFSTTSAAGGRSVVRTEIASAEKR